MQYKIYDVENFAEMQVKREFIIVPENFKALTKGQQRREINKGFVHALQRQICLDEKLSVITNYKIMVDQYIKMVVLNTKLRVYSQYFIREDYPPMYQDPPKALTFNHLEDYRADTLSLLEQLKRCEKADEKLQIMRSALNDILVTQQDVFDFLKPGKHWDNYFDTEEPKTQTNGKSDSSFDSSTHKEDMNGK